MCVKCVEHFFSICSYRKHSRSSTSNTTNIGNIENEYIRNLQQQIYFLELEANYLYPLLISLTKIFTRLAGMWSAGRDHP